MEEIQHHKRESNQILEKKQIGKTACSYISEDDTIFIDESSTALAMVDYLPTDIEFSLVTTSLLVSKRVSAMDNVKLYLLGGLYDDMSYSFGGYMAEQAMQFMTVDRFFFSCKGIDLKQGGTEGNEERARLKKNLLQSAQWACALADHTKLGLKARFAFIFPSSIDLLITDDAASTADLKQYELAGIKTQTTTTPTKES